MVTFIPACEAPPKPGNILVVEPGDFETKGDGKLFRVDPKSGARALLSDFGNTTQGTPVGQIGGVDVEPSGIILVTGLGTGTESKGALFRVDPKSGARTLLSDFGNAAQGPQGADPFGVAVEPSGSILVMDPNADHRWGQV